MKPKYTHPLQAAADKALIDGMPPGLRAALDDALAKGESRRSLLARVRRQTGGLGWHPGGLTYAAVEAYLERRAVGG